MLRTVWKKMTHTSPKLNPTNLFHPQENIKNISAYFNELKKSGKKVLVLFAIGGGNDNFSVIHVGNYFKKFHGFEKVIFFGVLGLTPFHAQQEFKTDRPEELPDEEKVMLVTKHFRRYLQTKRIRPISGNESKIPEILEQEGLSDCPYYVYSSKYSPTEIAHSVKAIIDMELASLKMSEKELAVIPCDFGADVLVKHHLSVISPELDALSIRMIQSLKYSAEVPKLSLIFWPGVDGELSQAALLSYFAELKPAILAQSNINDKSPYFETLIRIYDQIKKWRLGNTIPNAIKMLRDSQPGELSKTLTSRIDPLDLTKKKYTITEPVKTLDVTEDLVRTATLLPVAALVQHNPFAQITDQEDLFAFFIKVMFVYDQIKQERGVNVDSYPDQERTDFHMQYVWVNKKWLTQILISPTSYDEKQSHCLLEGGIKNIQDESVDIALLSTKQFAHFATSQPLVTKDIESVAANRYTLLWKKPDLLEPVKKLKERIEQLESPVKPRF